MVFMKRDIKTITAITAGTALLGTGLYVAVPAGATEPRTAPSASPSDKRDKREHRRWQGDGPGHMRTPMARRAWRGVHGQATVRRGGEFVETAWQRGEITAISGSTLTVRSEDGVSWQWTANGGTRVRKNRDTAELSALAVGDQVFVAGPAKGGSRTAKAVLVRKK
jgi:hypothetical protein